MQNTHLIACVRSPQVQTRSARVRAKEQNVKLRSEQPAKRNSTTTAPPHADKTNKPQTTSAQTVR